MPGLHLAQEIIDIIWPVGSIYLSTNNVDPSILFGGTWVAIEGKMLIGAGTYTDSENVSKTFNLNDSGGYWRHRHGANGERNGSLLAAVGSTSSDTSRIGFKAANDFNLNVLRKSHIFIKGWRS